MVELAARSATPVVGERVRPVAVAPRGDGKLATSVRRSAREVLEALAGLSGMGTWYVGRVDGEVVVPLAVVDDTDLVLAGRRLPWSATVCRRMVNGLGPTLAPDIDLIPNYARAPYAVAMGVRSFAGWPLHDEEGRLIGVLSGWSARPGVVFPEGLEAVGRAFAAVLGEVLANDVRADEEARQAERRAVQGRAADHATAAGSRLGWGSLLLQEEHRRREHGLPVALVTLDLGRVRSASRLQRATAAAAEALPRAALARLTARNIGAVWAGASALDVEAAVEELVDTLRAAGFPAAAGWATTADGEHLTDVWRLAEQRLYRSRRLEVAS